MFKMSLKNPWIGFLAAFTAAFCITLITTEKAVAQEGAALVEEIVVTARKREENILDVPLAITALSARDIENKGISEFKDIIAFTPGFHFAEHSVGRADRSNRILVIRGMHISQENDHQQAATVFVDGAPMHGSVIAGLEDAERIEVVRGPQSAYFGRATLSGAVNYVTKTPGQESKSKIVAEVGKYGTTNLGFSTEGPINDTTAYRIAISSQDTEGQYTAANTPTLKLGARQTVSFAGTLYFEPSDSFNAKLRYHTWEDDDGPGAAFGYGVNNGEELFNCNLPNSTLAARNGTNNWFCGVAPFPQDANIQYDAQMSPNKVSLLKGVPTAGLSIDTITDIPFLHGFGFAREASQASLVMNWSLDSGISISSITASNDNRWMALDDLDRRHNTDVPDSLRDVSLLNGRDLKDFSQEIRISSPQDQRLRWLLGLSKFSFEGKRTSGFHIFSSVRSLSLGNVFDIDTTGIFAAIEYDITDNLTVNVEGRRQKAVLDQLALSGIYKEIEEEELEMSEFGIKASLMDGRAWMQAAVYQGDWSAQQAAGAFVGDVFYGGTATGGEIDLSGYEIEGAWAVSDNFKLEATISNNDSEIKTLSDCADCAVLLGTSDISGMGKRKQRNPKTQRSLSGTIDGQMSSGAEWYLRADLLHTGSSYMTDANITETGSSNRVNMRYGIVKDNLRLELVGENLTNDKTFTNYQFLIDFAYLPPGVNRVLTGGLPDLRYYGVKATYSF